MSFAGKVLTRGKTFFSALYKRHQLKSIRNQRGSTPMNLVCKKEAYTTSRSDTYITRNINKTK